MPFPLGATVKVYDVPVVRPVTVHVCAPAVGGDARVDLLLQDLEDPLGHVPAEVGRWAGHGRAGSGRERRAVRVLYDHPAQVDVGIDVQGGAPHLGHAFGRNDQGEALALGAPVLRSGIGCGLDGGVFGDLGGLGDADVAADIDPPAGQLGGKPGVLAFSANRQRGHPLGQLGVVLGRPELRHHGQGSIGRHQNGTPAASITIGHGALASALPVPPV